MSLDSLRERQYAAARKRTAAMSVSEIDDALNRLGVRASLRDEIVERLADAGPATSMKVNAWTKDLNGAPRDRQLLARHSDWDCPVIVRCELGGGAPYWAYCEVVLSDMEGAVHDDMIPEIEWAEIPA